MSGIAGIFGTGVKHIVERMLDKIAHRGTKEKKIIETPQAVFGIICTEPQKNDADTLETQHILKDATIGDEHSAEAGMIHNHPMLKRDPLGVAPLYYGTNSDGLLGFASEVKALIEFTNHVDEFPPGHSFDGKKLSCYFQLNECPPSNENLETIVKELSIRLATSVEKRISNDIMGAWLSGGLDSSSLAALARPHVKTLHTFAVGLKNAPDLEFAQEVAHFIGSQHHENVVTLKQMIEIMPTVIYHLESFDALLVRSSITNYLAAQMASDYVSEVFSGEGGDELFGGYDYLKHIPTQSLPAELIDITKRLHNTALQRVDRCAAAHGTIAHIPFLDSNLLDYACHTPIQTKIYKGIEKWILRRAIAGKLPDRVLNRSKAKFWEGAGVSQLLADYAEKHISNNDFNTEHSLPNGWALNSKEELMYYRIFKEHFPTLNNLSWMGRTKQIE